MENGRVTRMEANVFTLKNLEILSSDYRFYRIKGLNSEHLEYYENRQAIIRKLSYKLQNPVTIIDRNGEPYLVVRDDAPLFLDPLYLVRAKATFELSSDTLKLDYTQRSPENDIICLRFLNFMLQAALSTRSSLWQPSSGLPFFLREPDHVINHIAQYRGFSVRAETAPDGGLGFCVDIKHKYISTRPLPHYISRDEFSHWKSQQCIYHYGHDWYQIQIAGLSDYDVSNHEVPSDNEWVPLLDFITREAKESGKPLPIELANLPGDTSVVLYYNNRNEERAAPTLLCYPTYGTEERVASKLHRRSIMPPHLRRRLICQFVERYLTHLHFGDSEIEVSTDPITIPSRTFRVPDLRFGGDKVLSVRGTPEAQHVSLERLGQARLALLYNKHAGFFERDPLLQQYLILPQSVADSYGTRFIDDLCRTVDELYPQKPGYEPQLITYDDRGPRTCFHQGKAILKTVNPEYRNPGYAVVMIHHTEDRKLREEDQLAALVMRELRPRIQAAVIHSDVGRECYQATWEDDEVSYTPVDDKYGKLSGYLRNVALNKILLNNRCWPFVLATPLNADLIIGIDTKNNFAGFVIVDKLGEKIWWESKTSAQKQRLRKRQIKAYLLEVLRKDLQTRANLPKTIVLHRDGQAYSSELEGAIEAIDQLKHEEALLHPDASLTTVEILKSPPVSLRLFEVTERYGRKPWVDNPQVGCYYLVNETVGYLCATGRPFDKNGTVNPLQIHRLQGPLSIEQCLEDIFSLTCLSWTRPEDCTRYPITVKLNDILLGAEASLYDREELNVNRILNEAPASTSSTRLFSGLYRTFYETATLVDRVLVSLTTNQPHDADACTKLGKLLIDSSFQKERNLPIRLLDMSIQGYHKLDPDARLEAGEALLSFQTNQQTIDVLEELASALEQMQIQSLNRIREDTL